MPRRFFTVLCFLIVSVAAYGQKRAEVRGTVRDAESGEVLAGASVVSDVGFRNTYTNGDGTYVITLPKGSVLLEFSYVGYQSQEMRLSVSGDTVLNVRLQPNSGLQEITIVAQKTELGARSTQMGTVAIPALQVKKAPAFLGEADVMKVLQLMPGVQSGGDGTAGVYIRGGTYDQNNLMMDGVTIYNAEHLKGFVSAFNPDVLDELVVHKGSFPARFGGRLSSVIEAHLKEGDFERYHASATVGLLSSKVMAEGPLAKGKTSFLAAARVSYFNLFTKPILERVYDKTEALTQFANMSYFDLNAKVTHKFSDVSKLSATVYWGSDVVGLDGVETQMETEEMPTPTSGPEETSLHKQSSLLNTHNRWGNILAGVHWDRFFGSQTSLHTGAHFSRFRYLLHNDSDLKDEIIPVNNPSRRIFQQTVSNISFQSAIEDYNITADIKSWVSTTNQFTGGIKLSLQQFAPIVTAHSAKTYISPFDSSKVITDAQNGTRSRLWNAAVYADDTWSPGELLKLYIGFRLNVYGVTDKVYVSPEPRASVRIMMAKRLSLKASYSYMSQAFHGLNSANLVMPSDVWVPVSKDLAPMTSHQASLGLFYDWDKKGIHFSLEGYYKTMGNVLEYKDGITFFNDSEGWENKVVVGDGLSYGIECLAQKTVGRTTGWIAYTWSKSLRLFDKDGNILNDGKPFFAKNDCRHNLSMTLSHQISKKWEVSSTFVYHTGYRATLSQAAFLGRYLQDLNVLPVNLYSSSREPILFISSSQQLYPNSLDGYQRLTTYKERNGFVMDAYHRLDVSISYTMMHKVGTSTLSFSIYNLYNRMNAYTIYPAFEKNRYVLKKLCLFPFMPSLSYSYHF